VATYGRRIRPSLGGLILFVVTKMAIAQLKIDTEMVRIVTSFILRGGALAFGLSLRLGTRDVVRNIVAGFYAGKFLVVGRSLEIAGQSGVLTAITATHTIVESDGKDVSIANATFLDQVCKQ
jgi:small-conductance mechanosensitive channel